MSRLVTEGWEYPRDGQFPPEGAVVETADSGGVHRLLVYEYGRWFFADRSMYVYFVPQSWRLAEKQAKAASGKRAFEQYCRNAGQEPLSWDEQPENVRKSWTAIATAAIAPAQAEDQEITS